MFLSCECFERKKRSSGVQTNRFDFSRDLRRRQIRSFANGFGAKELHKDETRMYDLSPVIKVSGWRL